MILKDKRKFVSMEATSQYCSLLAISSLATSVKRHYALSSLGHYIHLRDSEAVCGGRKSLKSLAL